MERIFYIGYYDTPENIEENRNIVLSATNKMNYIISVLEKLGYNTKVISVSATKNRQGYPAKQVKLGEHSELLLLKTLPSGSVWRRLISRGYMRFQLFRYLISVPKKDDKVMVYHSVAYTNIVRWAKKIKKFKLILEVEEIYADVNGREKDRKKECKLFRKADAFIFPTELLNEKVNIEGMPYSIIYGTYQVEPDRNCKFNDSKIHCVYAGTFDPRKGGVAAADAAGKLDSNYHIHILGFGNEKDKKRMIEKIEELSKQCECKITYDGLLSGEEYIRFIQSCDIGLSTQNPDAEFNNTSFPSKILSYMANGLRVVSIRIPAIEGSAVGKYISYYNEQTPEKIADAIRAIDFSQKYDSRKILSDLDKSFQNELGRLLND